MFEKLIKIPGKSSFADLSLHEVGLMIEADCAISVDGSEYFSAAALDEFLHRVGHLDSRPDLQKIQSEILANIYIDIPGEVNKKINVEFLKSYAENLLEVG